MIFGLVTDHHKGWRKIFKGKAGFYFTKILFEKILQ